MNHRYLVIPIEMFPLLSDRFLLFLCRVFVETLRGVFGSVFVGRSA